MVANRVKKNTRVYQALLRFLKALEIPFITSLRDAQAYVHAAGLGQGIFELPRHRVKVDLESWEPLLAWLTGDNEVTNARPAVGRSPELRKHIEAGIR